MTRGIALLGLAYVLSQFFRAFLAVLSPALRADIGAGPEDLAFASGLWFFAFAAMQLPVGWALDTVGPRRTAASLLLLGGGGGAAIFALASGPAIRTAVHVRITLVTEMLAMIRTGQGLNADSVQRSISLMKSGTRPSELMTANILSSRGKTIRPKTLNQKKYVEAIDKNTIVFGIGPAGTGKTYLAVAKAIQALQAKQVTRIVLTRPAVEAGEKLGFLPGTLSEKIDPYLRPLYDALHDMIDPDSIPRLITSGTIEIAPLAHLEIIPRQVYRTINDSSFRWCQQDRLFCKCEGHPETT